MHLVTSLNNIFPIDLRSYIYFFCLKEIKVKYKGEKEEKEEKEKKKKGTTTEIGLGVMRVISCLSGQFFFWFLKKKQIESKQAFPSGACAYHTQAI